MSDFTGTKITIIFKEGYYYFNYTFSGEKKGPSGTVFVGSDKKNIII